jgi:hypothetical protein
MGIQQPSVFPQPLGGFHDDVAERCDVEMPLAVLILSGVDLGFILFVREAVWWIDQVAEGKLCGDVVRYVLADRGPFECDACGDRAGVVVDRPCPPVSRVVFVRNGYDV